MPDWDLLKWNKTVFDLHVSFCNIFNWTKRNAIINGISKQVFSYKEFTKGWLSNSWERIRGLFLSPQLSSFSSRSLPLILTPASYISQTLLSWPVCGWVLMFRASSGRSGGWEKRKLTLWLLVVSPAMTASPPWPGSYQTYWPLLKLLLSNCVPRLL